MNRLKVFLLSVLLLPAGVAFAAPLGLARSENPFQVVRSLEELVSTPRLPLLVRPGDLLRAGDKPVRLDGSAGETLLVGEGSVVRLDTAERLLLEQGEVAMALPGSKDFEIQFGDLQILPVAGEQLAPGQLAVAGYGENGIELITRGRMLRILDGRDGSPVATLGLDDAMRLLRGADGIWTPVSPSADFGEEFDSDELDDGNPRKSGLLGLLQQSSGGGTAGGGAVAGGVAVVGGGTIATAGVAGGVVGFGGITDEETTEEESPTTPPPDENE